MPLAHVAAVRLDGCWEAICWRARGALIRLFERPMSGRLALGELHTVLQREAREARQFETNALSLLFKPRAQGGSNANHDLVRYSLFRHRNITSEDLTCEESNPARNAIECRFSAVTLSGTVLFGT
jgi:hypothetical protein